MNTKTQYSPDLNLNKELLRAGVSKTVYALVTPQVEKIKDRIFGEAGSKQREKHLSQFREAWTGKQDAYHREFFETWFEWSSPVVDIDEGVWQHHYPTAGASEGLRHLIYAHAIRTEGKGAIHVFKGEYEGYKAMAEACDIQCVEHSRRNITHAELESIAQKFTPRDLFLVSQPSAIDGNVWKDFNFFVSVMPKNSIVADITYVGSVPSAAVEEKFDLNAASIENIVFSLSKPFGVYYDRIGGVLSREVDGGLFGNKWFKNLTSLELGTALLKAFPVFHMPRELAPYQGMAMRSAEKSLGFKLQTSDVAILATGTNSVGSERLARYVFREEGLRVCLTPEMSRLIRRSLP